MADQSEHYEKSWILHHVLDRMIGRRELVDIRRKMYLLDEIECINEGKYILCHTGSRSEGFLMKGSDSDVMLIDRNVGVMCSNQDTSIPSDNRDKTIAIMRKAASRSCYVTLELVQKGHFFDQVTMQSLVPIRDKIFISSEINAKLFQEQFLAPIGITTETHGPSSSMKNECSGIGYDMDFVFSYGCTGWPPEANEWLSRRRHHRWPKEELINDISQSGCHVVPVGDKTSADTFLQWRISFATAERRLIHSLNHEQFLVYGLLKLFLKQISEILKRILEDEEILSSYIMKTVIFFAVENAPQHVWKEQNTFLCFRFCLKILISWVNAGYCPNYFIVSNNMFQGKLHGGKQETLLRFLMEMYNMKWKCLSVGTFIQPTIGGRIQRVMDGHWETILFSPKQMEYECDETIFDFIYQTSGKDYVRTLAHLTKSQSDMDEFISYFKTTKALSYKAINTFGGQQTTRGNKQKILISWVNAGYCPNYFIVSNNMFQGKLHGGKQETLLRFLMEMYNMKWKCLSVGTFIQPTIGGRIQRVMDGHWETILFSPKQMEYECDETIFDFIYQTSGKDYVRTLAHLTKSQSDMDEFISYFKTTKALSYKAINTFGGQQTTRGNKQKYKFLRKCKNFIAPLASGCTSPGLLVLATFYYQTGNHMKALMACGAMLSSFKFFIDQHSEEDRDKYQQLYCGRGYTLLLELGDRRRGDTALTQLRAVKYDEHQGRSKYWIVNNLLGICYELLGDTTRAIREYQESLSGSEIFQQHNPAKEKIARLHQSQGESF